MAASLLYVVAMLALLAAPSVEASSRLQTAHLSSAKACEVLQKRMAVHDGVPRRLIKTTWYCDVTTDEYNDHPQWWVIGLRSFRKCDGICSNLRGWFAVDRTSGEVREWNVADMVLGGPIGKP